LFFGNTTLFGWSHGCQAIGVKNFVELSLLNSKITTHFFTMFILMQITIWNTIVNVGCVGWNNMTSLTQCQSFSLIIPYHNWMDYVFAIPCVMVVDHFICA
jgi:hypothetical protein